ncbi:AAA family ATPase [Candidatus Poribacteria bacterium]|nr:AAA family ATPase [Candidatus Poribacteria bacterium]
MKIAVAGKGGVGKSTIAGMLARMYAENDYNILAVDVDPDSSLARCIGLSDKQIENIKPLSEMKDMIKDRTGAKDFGVFGTFFKSRPKVDDIPEKFSILHKGVRFLQVGSVKEGGSGCYCAENAFIRELMKHLLLKTDDIIIMDMEAGIEHLSRGTGEAVDLLIIVVEPGKLSFETAERIRDLAHGIGIPQIAVIGNKIRNDKTKEIIRSNLADFKIMGFLPYDEKLVEADLEGISPYDIKSDFKGKFREIFNELGDLFNNA